MPLALVVLSLSGCKKENYNSLPAAATCLPLVEYDRAFQQQLASEVIAARDDAAFPLIVQDYMALRDQIKAGCELDSKM